MRKLLFLGIFAGCILLSLSGYGAQNFVPQEVLVKVKPKRAISVIPSLGKSFRILSYKRAFEKIEDERFASVYKLKFPKDVDIFKVIEAYKKDLNVEYAEPNYIVKALFTPNDPYFGMQWGLDKIKANNGWDITMGTTGVIIAIIDTGIDLDHPDLYSTSTPFSVADPKIIKGYDYVNNDLEPDDDNGHGSHVAGIASALTNNEIGGAGVAGDCKVLAIKVLNKDGYGEVADVAYAILEASRHPGIKVINLSLGGSDFSQVAEDACDEARNKGILVVAAAGNENSTSKSYPAGYDSVMAVAATDLADKKTSFSNYGDWVDICAPGEQIFSTINEGKYANYDGTSMASPFVAGLAGLLFSHFQGFSAEKIREIIEKTADSVTQSGLGAGRINVQRALEQGGANFPPEIISLYVSEEYFSPGTSTGSKDFITLYVESDELGTFSVKVDGLLPDGNPIGNLTYDVSAGLYRGAFTWNGSYTDREAEEGSHIIEVTVFDEYGSSTWDSISVVIDRIWPLLSLNNNTGGDVFYRDEVIQFTLKTKDIDVDVEEGRIRLVQDTLTREVSVFSVGEGTSEEGNIYQGYYPVAQADVGSFTVCASFIDRAGNPPTESIFGTITLDGSRIRPTQKARITRIGFIPEKENRPSLQGYTITGSETDTLTIKWENEDLSDGQKIKVVDFERKHIWVGTSSNRTVSLNNGFLYYGTPINDYTKVNPGTSYALKKTLKAGDDIVFSLEGVKIDSEFSLGALEKYQGSITISHSSIAIGKSILISDNKTIWMATATNNGLFTISNQNLYSGPFVSDYTNISPSFGGMVSPACGGDSKIDIGSVVKSIQLSDDAIDGIGILSGDIFIGDGIYSGVYTIKEGNDTNDAQIIGKFIFNRKSAENSPYQDERQKITIDATAPIISNNSVSPIPFNPYLTNLSIKYNLSEKAYVKIRIYDSSNNLIRILESPEAQFGENVTLNWDGKNSGGFRVSDAHYTYYIEAEDEAGNKAITKEGEIVLTSIEIAIENLNVAPNPFWPDKEVLNSVDAVISFRAVLKSSRGGNVTETQLNNLGFNFNFYRENYITEAGFKYYNYLNAPYGLFDLKIYDQKGGVLTTTFFPDLSKDDIDWDLHGLPFYADGSHFYDYSLGNPAEPDKGDGNAGNDYGNLVAFDKDTNGNYSFNFNYGVVDWDIAEGTYIFRVGASLVSIMWELVNDSGEAEEKWHAYPDYFLYSNHYNLKSEIVDKEVSVQPPPPPVLPDTEPPVVEVTNPSAGQVIDSGSITLVWARLKEKPDSGASGIDFARSEIFLVDKTGQKVAGHQENDGVDIIRWVLDTPLDNSSPGSYTIKVKPVDVKGNGLAADYQGFSFIMKDITKPEIHTPYPADGSIVISPFSGPIEVFLSDIGKGESGIDWENSSISLKKGYTTISITQDHYVTPNTNNNAGKIMGNLSEPLLGDGSDDGTYTIFVKAYDGAGNVNSTSFSFYFKTIFPFIINPEPPNGDRLIAPYSGAISAEIIEEYIAEREDLRIDWATSTISLTGPYGNVELTKSYELGTSPNTGRIIGKPKSSLPAGDYTWSVKAYDYAGHSISSIYTFNVRIVMPTIYNPYPSGDKKAPYSGTISVDVKVVDNEDPDLNTTTLTLSLKKGGTDIPATVTYYGDNRQGRIVGTISSPLTEGGEYTIEAYIKDTAGNTGAPNKFYFNVFWLGPSIDVFTISADTFSPYTSIGECDTITVSFSADEDGTYSITVDGRTLANAQGAYTKGSLTSYIWNGKDVNNGTFTEGTHSIMVSIVNFGGKTGTKTEIITIDSTPINILSLLADDYRFSPATSTGVQDTTNISFSIDGDGSYSLTIDGSQITSGSLKKDEIGLWTWNGAGFGEGSHTIELKAKDSVANVSTRTISIYIDNTPPAIESITENTGGRTFYKDEEASFILKTYETGIVEAQCILNSIVIPLFKLQDNLWSGSYKIKESDKGIWEIKGSITDEAGNPGTNNDTIMGTISVDGTRLNPITTSRIARLGIIPEKKEQRELGSLTITGSSTDSLTMKWLDEKGLIEGQSMQIELDSYIWITTFKNQEAIISNAELYYENPIADYRSITPQRSYSLKSVLKKDDNLIISLTAVRVENTISPLISTKTSVSLTITSSDIKIGRLILVSDNIHTWLSQANQDGTFTISNQNLYSGPFVFDYNAISSIIVEDVLWATGGNGGADIGSYRCGIQLVDNGLSSFFDKFPGDGIYSGFYRVKENDNISSAPIYSHFVYNNENAENDGYTDSRLNISLDGSKPVVSNFNTEPSPFNPEKGHLDIGYHLSEEASVRINIYNSKGENIRTIIPFSPKMGENTSDLWDGRDNMGDMVSEGLYYSIIDACDAVGNYSDPISKEIIVSYLNMRIISLNISPQPFLPSPDSPESSLLIKFTVILDGSNYAKPTDLQLKNLGFDLRASPQHLNFPYVFLNLQIFDKDNKPIVLENYPDMSPNKDIDPWLGNDGMPNYGGYDKGSLAVTAGDGNTGNDYGNLVPFLKDINGNYYYNYEFSIKNWKNPAGKYTFQVSGNLVSIHWEENLPDSNKWHAKPYDWGHYGLNFLPVSCQFDVSKIPEPPLPDNTPPSVSATYPSEGSSQAINTVGYVWVKMEDNVGGVGVNFDKSTIELYDSKNQEIIGSKVYEGQDKIWLYLPSTLTTPGNYSIKGTVYDKNGNFTPYSIRFTIADTIPPIISDPWPSGSVISPFSGPITANISELGCGESGINGASSTISLKRDGVDIPLTSSYKETGSNTGQIIGNLISPLTESGTYTIIVVAYDNKGNMRQATFYFNIPKEIEVIYNGNTYLDIPYGTEIIPPSGNNIPVASSTVFVSLLADTLDHKEYKLIGSITKFYYGTQSSPLYKCKFAKNVTLTLHYKDYHLPSPQFNEQKLFICGSGSSWTNLGGTPDPANNKISLIISASTEIKDIYAIMYNEDVSPIIQHGTPSVVYVNEPINIKAVIYDEGVGLNLAKIVLYYQPLGLQTIGTKNYESTSGTNTFIFNIPSQNKCTLNYWILASDNNGNEGSATYQVNVATKEEAEIEKSVYTSPNPAKGSTKFNFFLETKANVKIKLYTITGDLVWDYEGDFSDGGKKEVGYSCTNKDGKKLGTGLYIYKVTIEYPTKTERVIKKMVIIKQ
ncbi:MAG: S8 family serine peptidase [bacterium]